MTGSTRTALLAVSVHGPTGVLDLHVPAAASVADLATEYSRQARLPSVPTLYTRLGAPIPADLSLEEAGVTTGALLVALAAEDATPARRRRGGGDRVSRRPGAGPGALSSLWFSVAVAAAVLAGAYAASLPDSDLRSTTIGLLIGAAVVGVVPLGPLAAHRVLAAPAFAGAAAFAIAWDPTPELLPTLLGVSALAAGIAAAVGRALDRNSEEGLRIWTFVGVGLFVVTTLTALLDVSAQVVWAVLLLVATLAPRFVPLTAVDVPDQFLLDLERLAVTAWSARDRPTGRRGRIVVPRAAVVAVAARGARMITAACAAILVVTVVSAPLLLSAATRSVDPIGARCEVGLAGAAMLLAARSYRHAGARTLLRVSGLWCWLSLSYVLFGLEDATLVSLMAIGSIGLGAVLVLVGVALGRGWRSAWWSRRAEVAEGMCGAFACGSVVVAAGIFRALWN